MLALVPAAPRLPRLQLSWGSWAPSTSCHWQAVPGATSHYYSDCVCFPCTEQAWLLLTWLPTGQGWRGERDGGQGGAFPCPGVQIANPNPPGQSRSSHQRWLCPVALSAAGGLSALGLLREARLGSGARSPRSSPAWVASPSGSSTAWLWLLIESAQK